jgi:hypothetical protein
MPEVSGAFDSKSHALKIEMPLGFCPTRKRPDAKSARTMDATGRTLSILSQARAGIGPSHHSGRGFTEWSASINLADWLKMSKKTTAKKSDTAKRSPGRPSDYSQKTALEICKKLGNGESLRQICASSGMPGKTTIIKWLESNLDFRAQYARARELQAEHWAEEIIQIADDSRNDFIEKENRDGSTYEAVDNEHINRSRLRVDTRKWLMARLAPKKYGDRVTTEMVGDADNPLQCKHIVEVVFIAAEDGRPAVEGNG